ncbi:hypothetical protein, partial [Streptomyces albidoflavus]|uniref:hypothetical protein n=1 Tax=Streptomyces albidoflavus TaxID=1886 RepID=UPI001140FCC6
RRGQRPHLLRLIDLFRHVCRGELTPFAGGAEANQGLEQQFWPEAPYTEEDLPPVVCRTLLVVLLRGHLPSPLSPGASRQQGGEERPGDGEDGEEPACPRHAPGE